MLNQTSPRRDHGETGSFALLALFAIGLAVRLFLSVAETCASRRNRFEPQIRKSRRNGDGRKKGRFLLETIQTPGETVHLPFEWPENPKDAHKGVHIDPPIRRYLARNPWFLPRLLNWNIPSRKENL
jgi:hypothetical protein